MARIPLPWPSPDVLEQLVEKSSGHFIYASTIIKFIDDKNYRPTERLALVQNPSSGAESAFDTLDQLYKTILSSAPRQCEIVPILCAIFDFEMAVPCHIDLFFGLADGETQLLLRNLNSVIAVPISAAGEISSHHASFVDFLKDPDRSGNFCIGTLNRRIGLARSLLQFYASPFQRNDIYFLSRLIHFIVSLPASSAVAELAPLIGSMNPDNIFQPYQEEDIDFASLVSWLKNTPSAPADVIQLWEDYAFMFSIDEMQWSPQSSSLEPMTSPSPECLRILVSMGLLRDQLEELPTKLDLTWTDLRTTLCSLRPKLVGDEHALPIHQPRTAYPWTTRDLALQLIRRMVKNHIDTEGGLNPAASCDAVLYNEKWNIRNLEDTYTRSQFGLGCDIGYVVRLSPP